MIIEKANAVTRQAEVVAREVEANPEVVNTASLNKLEGLCEQLKETIERGQGSTY
jgi:hypothetical protein